MLIRLVTVSDGLGQPDLAVGRVLKTAQRDGPGPVWRLCV